MAGFRRWLPGWAILLMVVLLFSRGSTGQQPNPLDIPVPPPAPFAASPIPPGAPNPVTPPAIDPLAANRKSSIPMVNKALPPVQYVNQRLISLEFELAKVGSSGVGHLELWVTKNDGATWEVHDGKFQEKIGNGVHVKMVTLPADGVYGFAMSVTSRAGLGKNAPKANEVPQLRVEVDTEAPKVQLLEPMPHPSQSGALLLKWTASDKNLGDKPITLEWTEKPDGPWNTIAEIANTGQHAWRVPANLPPEVFLRIRVRDMAGNEAIAVTPKAVLVDMSVPEIQLLRVTVPNPATLPAKELKSDKADFEKKKPD